MLDVLINTTRPGTAATTVAQLNAQALRSIAQGQVVRLLAQSPVPVAPGSVLQLQLSPGVAPRITRIEPPDLLPQEIRTFIGRALSRQGSPAPLLQQLQRSLSGAGASLPEGIRHIGHQLLALFPGVQGLRQPGAMQSFLQTSGLFMEAHLATAARQAQANTMNSSAAGDTREDRSPGPSSLMRAMGQLRDQWRSATSNESTNTLDSRSGAAAEAERPMALTNDKLDSDKLSHFKPNDYKALLLQLQQQLNALRNPLQVTRPGAGQGPQQGTGSPSGPSDAGTASAPPGITTGLHGKTGATPKFPMPSGTNVPSADEAFAPEKASANDKTLPADKAPFVDKGLAPDKVVRQETSPALAKTTAADASNESAGGTDVTDSAGQAEGKRSPSALVGGLPARFARAADQYQRLEQITRPPPATSPGEQGQTDDLASVLNDIPTELDIPGMGLPLPHRLKPRNEDAGDSLEQLVELLLKRTQESLNRLHLHQLSHSGTTSRDAGQTQQNPPLTFDLPVFFDGQIQVFNTRIDEEEIPSPDPAHPGKKVRQWSVSLGFDIEGLGPMFCQLQMTEQQAQLQFWADRPATLALTRANLDFLSKSLHDLGVAVSEVSCHEGMPKQTRTRLSQQLVDIST